MKAYRKWRMLEHRIQHCTLVRTDVAQRERTCICDARYDTVTTVKKPDTFPDLVCYHLTDGKSLIASRKLWKIWDIHWMEGDSREIGILFAMYFVEKQNSKSTCPIQQELKNHYIAYASVWGLSVRYIVDRNSGRFFILFCG